MLLKNIVCTPIFGTELYNLIHNMKANFQKNNKTFAPL